MCMCVYCVMSDGVLFLGSKDDALNIVQLNKLRIRTIINCTTDEAISEAITNDPTQYTAIRLAVEDEESADVSMHFDKAFELIEAVRKQQSSNATTATATTALTSTVPSTSQSAAVLVHCQLGVSRSASIVIAYLIR